MIWPFKRKPDFAEEFTAVIYAIRGLNLKEAIDKAELEELRLIDAGLLDRDQPTYAAHLRDVFDRQYAALREAGHDVLAANFRLGARRK